MKILYKTGLDLNVHGTTCNVSHVQNVRESAGGCWGVREIFQFSSEESNHIGNLLQYLDVEQFIFWATEFNCHLASTEPPASKVSKYCTAEKCLF